ncbi:DUF2145 domain-containing protein [Gammaproteobacteria bacterium]|nr:DUF2145 domain-containing protein [Gammaproteobacteria bacterium]
MWLIAAPSWAGSNAGGEGLLNPVDIASFSKRVEQALANTGAHVAIIARTGRPSQTLPAGIHYTHVAFAVYSQITQHDGATAPGYATYNLYQSSSQPDRSVLVQDFLFDFFMAVPELKVGILVPSIEVQRRLLGVITGEHYAQLHNPRYSVVANPNNNLRQNCTEFVLNVVQSALYQSDNMSLIKQTIVDHFEPTPIRVNRLLLLGSSIFSKGLSLADHDGRPKVVTFTSLAQYFRVNNMALDVIHISDVAAQ